MIDSPELAIRDKIITSLHYKEGVFRKFFTSPYNGRLRLLVYSDINEQDPQIIDLQNALESNRNFVDMEVPLLSLSNC